MSRFCQLLVRGDPILLSSRVLTVVVLEASHAGDEKKKEKLPEEPEKNVQL